MNSNDIQPSLAPYFRHACHFLNTILMAEEAYDAGGKTLEAFSASLDKNWHQILQGQNWTARHASAHRKIAMLCSIHADIVGCLGGRLSHSQCVVWLVAGIKAARLICSQEAEASCWGNLGLTFLEMGKPSRAIAYHERALLIAGENRYPAVEAKQWLGLGNCHMSLGSYGPARQCYDRALVIARHLNDRKLEGILLGNIGTICFRQGRLDQSIECHEASLGIAREYGDVRNEALQLRCLADRLLGVGDYEGAHQYLEDALLLARLAKHYDDESDILGRIGHLYKRRQVYERAVECYRASLRIKRDRRIIENEVAVLGSLGAILLETGNYQEGKCYLREAKTLAELRGEKLQLATCVHNLGRAYMHERMFISAASEFRQTIRTALDMGDKHLELHSLISLSSAYESLTWYRKAVSCTAKALRIAKELQLRAEESTCLAAQGIAFRGLEEYDKAVACLVRGLRLARRIGDRLGECNLLGNLGMTLFHMGLITRAQRLLRRALRLSEKIGNLSEISQWTGALGRCYTQQGELEKAIASHEQGLSASRLEENTRFEALHCGDLGNLHLQLGHYDAARSMYTDALVIARRTQEFSAQSKLLISIGRTWLSVLMMDRAIESFRDALRVAKDHDDDSCILDTLTILAEIFGVCNRNEEAIVYLQEAVTYAGKISVPEVQAAAFVRLAVIARNLAKAGESATLRTRALTAARSIGFQDKRIDVLVHLGRICITGHDMQSSLTFYNEALSACHSASDKRREARVLLGIGEAMEHLGERSQALMHVQNALDIYTLLRAPEAEDARKILGEMDAEKPDC